jgi:hypothetical protein
MMPAFLKANAGQLTNNPVWAEKTVLVDRKEALVNLEAAMAVNTSRVVVTKTATAARAAGEDKDKQ